MPPFIHESPSAYQHRSKPIWFPLRQAVAVTTATKGNKKKGSVVDARGEVTHESRPGSLETYLNPSCCVRWHAPIAFCSAQTEASSPSSGTSTRSSTRFPSTGNNSTPHRSVYHSASPSFKGPHAAFSFPSNFLLSHLSRTFYSFKFHVQKPPFTSLTLKVHPFETF